MIFAFFLTTTWSKNIFFYFRNELFIKDSSCNGCCDHTAHENVEKCHFFIYCIKIGNMSILLRITFLNNEPCSSYNISQVPFCSHTFVFIPNIFLLIWWYRNLTYTKAVFKVEKAIYDPLFDGSNAIPLHTYWHAQFNS